MNRLYVLVLMLSTLGMACGGAANTANYANRAAANNSSNSNVNTSVNTASNQSIDDRIKSISDNSQQARNQIMANAKQRAQESLNRQKTKADKDNEELKRKVEELKNRPSNVNP